MRHKNISRRQALTTLGAAAAAVAMGCSSDGNTGPDDPDGGGQNPDGGQELPAQCSDTSGMSAAQLLAPIDTFVVLCMENRSFDHYLGALKLVEQQQHILGLGGGESNPTGNGTPVPIFNLLDYTPADPPHEWDACHEQWNQGRNDGFVRAHAGPDEKDVMGYHVRAQIPITYALADGAAICQRYFSSVMGPTWPNRFYLHGATSNGGKANAPILFGYTSIWDRLNDVGLRGVNYYHDIPWCTGAFLKGSGLSGISNFFQDAVNGTLPHLSIIDPQFFGAGANDDHPDHDIQLGQALIASIFRALAASPQWNRCLFVLTYDEHGGFYDHVPPPTTTDSRPEFTQLGFRVPTLVAGPYVRRGCTVDTVLDHVSVLKTLTTRFNVTPLNARHAAANDLASTISPMFLSNPQPAPQLPQLLVSMSRLRAREAEYRASHHGEMWQAAEQGLIPRHLDRRSPGIGEMQHVLDWGERLGAIKLVP
jgi:phospholipase C